MLSSGWRLAKTSVVESVLEGGIEKSGVSRQFFAASSNPRGGLRERRLEDLHLVVLMIDGIHASPCSVVVWRLS